MKELKPVVFVKAGSNYFQKGIFQQNMLLKILPFTDDLDQLKNAVQIKSKAGVLRTLDKISMRKEFHAALERHNLNIDNIVDGFKKLEETTDDDKIKLGVYQTILKALGLDKYEAEDGEKGNWEEILLKTIQVEKRKEDPKITYQNVEYEVMTPEIPEAEKKRREDDLKIEKGIYE